jgi:choline dehydrogenase-like flavoprotein
MRDAVTIPAGSTLEYDVCIAGAGFAGITLALELGEAGLRVGLLESGGKKADPATQDLYRGVVTSDNHAALEGFRQRRLGGTSTVWGGRCAPFDAIDFEPRDARAGAGWPFALADLEPFYRRAYEWCELGRYGVSIEELLPAGAGEMIPGLASTTVLTDRLWLFSPPTNFARKYGPRLEANPHVDVVTHANVLSVEAEDDGNEITHLEVSSLQMNRFRVKARVFLLAMGGLETTRLLLLSDRVHENGIGNRHDMVGRFYVSHIAGSGIRVALSEPTLARWDYDRTVDGVYARRCLRIDEAEQRRRGLLNFRANFDLGDISDPDHGSAVLSLFYLAKRFVIRKMPPEYLFSNVGYRQVPRHLLNCLKGLPSLVSFAFKLVRERLLPSRKLPSLMLRSRSGTYDLHFDAEQRPNPESRVFLSSELDAFGQRRLQVDWRYRDDDIESAFQSLKLIHQELERTGAGRLETTDEGIKERLYRTGVGSHHIGLTRMSSDPRDGVVDADCRVHGISNLFIASSSVFPTGSFANPTLTIVALAVRLADHVRALLARDRSGGQAGRSDGGTAPG